MGSTRHILGIDIGGSKCHALVADETGRALGFGQSGPGNPEVVGYSGMTDALCSAAHAALAAAGSEMRNVASAALGIAGYDWPSQKHDMQRAIWPLGLDGPYEIENDAIVGMLAGAREGWGVGLVAGTGCNCRGWDRTRREGRVLGVGPLAGENAGGSEIVLRAMQAVSYEWTRRGPATRLTQAFIERTGARDIADLMEGATTRRYLLSAMDAPLVFTVAAEGDPVAGAVIEWAGRELGDLALGVIRQLDFEAIEFDLVLVGSLYNAGGALLRALDETVHRAAPGARLVRLIVPPVVGAVLLGMETAGIEALPLRQRLVDSTLGLLNGSGASPGG